MSFYNYLVDYTLVDNGTITEPVTLAEAKNYCRVSTTADDSLITILITQAREAIEKATGLCLTSKLVSVWFNNPAGNLEMPFGPMDPTTFKLYDLNTGNEVLAANYFLTGDKFPSLNFPIWNKLKATYTSGYSTVPKDLKVAILDQIDFDYENRGADVERYDQTGVCQKAWRACQRYTRVSPIL
jgi:uncharacterized phiE125 gp8 family phage protein